MTYADALAGLAILSAVNYAITLIITDSKLFEPIRDGFAAVGEGMGEFIQCALCTGTWVGFGIAGLTVWRLGLTGWDIPLVFFLIAFSTVTGAVVYKRITNW